MPPPATIQNDFSLLHRKFEEDGTAEACAPVRAGFEPGVGLLAYGVLAGGALSGKYVKRGDGTRAARVFLLATPTPALTRPRSCTWPTLRRT